MSHGGLLVSFYNVVVLVFRWLGVVAVGLLIVAVWAATVSVMVPAAQRGTIVCGTALATSTEFDHLLGRGEPGLPQRLVSGEVNRQIVACQDARARQQELTLAAVAVAALAATIAWEARRRSLSSRGNPEQ